MRLRSGRYSASSWRSSISDGYRHSRVLPLDERYAYGLGIALVVENLHHEKIILRSWCMYNNKGQRDRLKI